MEAKETGSLQAEAKLKEAQSKLKEAEAKLVESEAKLKECEMSLKAEKQITSEQEWNANRCKKFIGFFFLRIEIR